jgi:D-arabinose 1-dehydrogenase-like Zn-dependent alcohol dehydrogenase
VTVRALVYRGPGVVEVDELPDPAPAPGEVILDVLAAGICGTDRHIVSGELAVPPDTVPGHEVAGRVAGAGPGVTEWEVGRRVVCYGQVVCGTCRPCREGAPHRCRRPQVLGMNRQGGFAERLAVPAGILIPVPDRVPDTVAAIVPDALATPYHALVAVGEIRPDDTVVVIGTGGVGLQAVALARRRGSALVVGVDLSEEARRAARAAGAHRVVDSGAADPAGALYEITGGATLALECVGRSETVELGMRCLAPGGRLVVVGVGHDRPRLPPLLRFVAGEYAIRGSFGATVAEIETVLDRVADGSLDVSHAVFRRVTLDEAPAVFATPPSPGRTVITFRQ